jgi:predicted phosphoadenosine phosphosulfate sulfurtransferase
MYEPFVTPMWYQIPFRLLNATSATESWLHVWGPGETWVRDKDPISFKDNVYGTDRFVDLMEAIMRKEFDEPLAVLTGVRTEESPGRFMGMTEAATYKGVTWGNIVDKSRNQYTFSPIYDWSFVDVWKAINDNGWTYNKHYDYMHRYGVGVRNMRVSNYHHETAVGSLFMLQEIEPETYERATQRISGLDTAGKMGKADYFPKELPFMFTSWREYRDYLLEHLVLDEKMRKLFAKRFASQEKNYEHEVNDKMMQMHITSIMVNDVDGTKLKNWEAVKMTVAQKARKEAHSAKLAGLVTES